MLARQAQEYLRYAFAAMRVDVQWSSWLGSAGVYLHASLGDATLEVKSAERPQHLVSVPVHGMWVNESATIAEGTWEGKLRSRLIATGGWCVLDTTPMGENWVFRDFYLRGLEPADPHFRAAAVVDTAPRCSPERQFCAHHWPSRENPAVDPEEVERARQTLPGWAFRREWEGNPQNYSGQIYPDWSERDHVVAHALVPPRREWEHCVVGVDWGYSEGHAGVMLVVARARGAWWVVREVAEYQQPLDPFWLDVGRSLEREFRPRTYWCDPAGGKEGSLRELDGVTEEADVLGAVNAVEDGIQVVAGLIKSGRLFVSDQCPGLVRELPDYRWAAAQDERFKQVPRKIDDDRVDALRYAIASELLGGEVTVA
jgi:hypothetical protein